MDTLPDYLDHGLDIVVIGQNPSPASIAHQCYYGNPRNRFWPAMRASGLVPEGFVADAAGFDWLLRTQGIGFTDVVKRPTPGAGDLRAADFRAWAPELERHLTHYRPRIAWFNGKGVYQSYLRYGRGERPDRIEFGEQDRTIAGAAVFVTPNPSPANAAWRPAALADWYRAIATLRAQICEPRDGTSLPIR